MILSVQHGRGLALEAWVILYGRHLPPVITQIIRYFIHHVGVVRVTRGDSGGAASELFIRLIIQ